MTERFDEKFLRFSRIIDRKGKWRGHNSRIINYERLEMKLNDGVTLADDKTFQSQIIDCG